MAKADTGKPKIKPKPEAAKEQYERFKKTARELGVDNPESVAEFERAFRKIVPPAKESKS
jgi:hypothetical protein